MQAIILLPISFAMIASIIKFRFNKNNFFFIEGVALLCAGICMLAITQFPHHNWELWWLVIAFLFSIIGDFFMKRLHSNKELKLGIIFFLLAHMGFLVYSLRHNGLVWWVFLLTIIPFAFIAVRFYQTATRLQEDKYLAGFGLVYIIMSCATLAANLTHNGEIGAWLFLLAISCLIVSDLLIAFRELYGNLKTNYFIMPLYYLCHILIAYSVIVRYLECG